MASKLMFHLWCSVIFFLNDLPVWPICMYHRAIITSQLINCLFVLFFRSVFIFIMFPKLLIVLN